MSNNDSANVGGYLAAFTIGALIGAGVALLYAPQSGEETRKLLAKKGEDLRDKAEESLEDAKAFIRGKQAEINAAVEAGKAAMREEREKQKKAA
jgi:gas vesicle protein